MNFTVEYLEYILLVFIRVASVVFVAPFFGPSEIPRRVKVAIAFFLSLTVMNQVDYKAVEYANILEYSGLVLKEAITGIIIGLGSRLCLYIFNFSGNLDGSGNGPDNKCKFNDHVKFLYVYIYAFVFSIRHALFYY